jgi:hypothetical protein
VPSSELTQVCVSGVSGVFGVSGADMTSEALAVGVAGVGLSGAGVPAAVPLAGVLAVWPLPVGRGGGVRIAASKRLNASLVRPAKASAAPANWPLSPAEGALPSLARRAARQIGHHWHSGGSSIGPSVVAVSQTSAFLPALAVAPPMVDFTRSVTSLVTLRAPALISQRWRSPIGSLPGSSLILAA